jgi:hypothetical protein
MNLNYIQSKDILNHKTIDHKEFLNKDNHENVNLEMKNITSDNLGANKNSTLNEGISQIEQEKNKVYK